MSSRKTATAATAAAARSEVVASVVVPAYKEGANLTELVKRVFAAFDRAGKEAIQRSQVEMIIVDDNSRDGSEEAVNALTAQGYAVKIIVRTAERGLSSAVIRGFDEAKGRLLLCMDADLQVRRR
jgi:dolichol-phosphate mannosyltransferase